MPGTLGYRRQHSGRGGYFGSCTQRSLAKDEEDAYFVNKNQKSKNRRLKKESRVAKEKARVDEALALPTFGGTGDCHD